MSVTVTKADGVTVYTLTSDSQSRCPPLCQILKGLCYSPACCSVSQHLRRVQRTSQSVLGTLHIIVGIFTIGLGAIWNSSGLWWDWYDALDVDPSFHFGFGAVFILCGIMNILSEKYPSLCLIIINVILNIVGVAVAIAAIVLNSITIALTWLDSMCQRYDHGDTPKTPQEAVMEEKCFESRALALMLLSSISAVLIVLSVLELCVTISSAVLGIKALKTSENSENKTKDNPEYYNPLQEEP